MLYTRRVTRSASRRSSDEVRAQIVRAAADEFSSHGYADATMRAVATAAGVSMSVLHHHFSSKQDLFSAALVTPFLSFFDEFATAWMARSEPPWDERELTREFVAHLYRNLNRYRSTLVNLLALSEGDPRVLGDVRQGLGEIRTRLQQLEMDDPRAHEAGLSPDAAPHANRMVVALVTGIVVLHPLLAEGGGDEDDHLIDMATDVLLHGIRSTSKGETPGRSA